MKLLIKNATLYGSDNSAGVYDVLSTDGIITLIAPSIDDSYARNADIVDIEGKVLLPGLIDMHCRVSDPDYESKEDIKSVSKAAAKTGVTSILCHPDMRPVIDNKTVVHYVSAKSNEEALVHIFPCGSMTRNAEGSEIAEIGEMKRAGIVAVSDGGCCVQDANLLRNIMLYSRMFDLPVMTICEDCNLSGGGVVNKGDLSLKTGLTGIPREAEEIIVARNLILARHTKARLHINAVSTEHSVDMIRAAKREGVNVTCDTSPQYFSLTEDVAETFNTLAKIKPPLRTRRDLEAVRDGIADGTIDVIASGHAPDSIESKRVEFDNASFGISSIETLFALSYTELVKTGLLTLSQLTQKMSETPARILSLSGKGLIEVGADADFFVVDTQNGYTINAAEFASRAKFSMHDGYQAAACVLYTFVDGRPIYARD